jgi:hypothetical protein
MPEVEAKCKVVMRHCPIRSVLQVSHSNHSPETAQSGGSVMDLVSIRIKGNYFIQCESMFIMSPIGIRISLLQN